MKFSYLNTIFNDAPQPWQLGFQDSAASGFSGIVELHNTIFFYLVLISVGVFWVLGSIVYYYSSKRSPIVHKYLNHGTLKCLHVNNLLFNKLLQTKYNLVLVSLAPCGVRQIKPHLLGQTVKFYSNKAQINDNLINSIKPGCGRNIILMPLI